MPSSKPPLHVANELGILLDGQSLEVLIDELVDPGSHFSRASEPRSGSADSDRCRERHIRGGQDRDGRRSGRYGRGCYLQVARGIFPDAGGRGASEKAISEVRPSEPLFRDVDQGRVTIEVPFNKDEIALPKRVQDQPSEENDFPDFATAQGSLPEPFA